jgi:16S rRNA (uracil1498-N3)-methyltransferase
VQRFFVDPGAIVDGTVTLAGPQARQMVTVLRMRVGDHCFALDNTGYQYEVEIVELTPALVRGAVRSRSLVTSEPRTKITVYQAMLKSDRFEYALQKGTEIGVVSFVPTITDRCVVGNIGDSRSAKIERWTRIITEAAEQAGRGKLPTLQSALLFPQAVESARGISLIPYEEERGAHLRDVLRHHLSDQNFGQPGSRTRPFAVNIFTGPEGGFSESEIALAKSYGIVPVTLGPRILRAETAALATATAILYETGDFG